MKFLIISGNPKKDGLCQSITEQIEAGAQAGGAEVSILKPGKIERCHVCGNGWGTCLEKNVCAFGKDGFNDAQQTIRDADAVCIITPVYWNEMSEGLLSFLDRFRRCEFGSEGALSNKQVLLVASAGGSGNGLLPCLEQMDRFCRHTGAYIFDLIGVNRWNHEYKAAASFAAAKAIAEGAVADNRSLVNRGKEVR